MTNIGANKTGLDVHRIDKAIISRAHIKPKRNGFARKIRIPTKEPTAINGVLDHIYRIAPCHLD